MRSFIICTHHEILLDGQIKEGDMSPVVWMGHMTHAYKILVGTPEGKRSLGSSNNRLNDNIKTDLKGTECKVAQVQPQ
jgi:hypothetical protein